MRRKLGFTATNLPKFPVYKPLVHIFSIYLFLAVLGLVAARGLSLVMLSRASSSCGVQASHSGASAVEHGLQGVQASGLAGGFLSTAPPGSSLWTTSYPVLMFSRVRTLFLHSKRKVKSLMNLSSSAVCLEGDLEQSEDLHFFCHWLTYTWAWCAVLTNK